MNDGAQEIIEALQRESDENYALWVSAQAREALLVEALRELVRLKEIKNEPRTAEEALTYSIAKEDAWQAARSALAGIVDAES